ncbi:MAG: hypothetical protein AB1861_30155, partial [Cyanobacteriota bacterium]
LARGKAWGENCLYCRRETFYSKRISVNQELESPTVYGGEYVKFLTFLKSPQQLTAHQPEHPLQSEEFGGHHKRKFCGGIL